MNTNGNQMQIEVFQPEISVQIQQTTLEELKNWIEDGKLKPVHRVRIKNLPWVEAQNIPAFKTLFESKKNNPAIQVNNFHNPPSPLSLPNVQAPGFLLSPPPPPPAYLKPEADKPMTAAASISKNPSLAISGTPVKSKIENSPVENKPPEISEPSVPFKIFEEKALAKSGKTELKKAESEKNESKTSAEPEQAEAKKQPVQTALSEPKPKPVKSLSKAPKKSSFAGKIPGFLAGCILMSLLSLGGAYLWVYQLKTAPEVDEKSLLELSNLDDKLTSDKLDLRVKAAAREQELKNTKKTENSVQPLDVAQEIAKLDSQYNERRKAIIENHRNNLQNNDFNFTLSFNFAVLMVLFILARIFRGKTPQAVEVSHSPALPNSQKREFLKTPAAANQNIEPENSQIADPSKTTTKAIDAGDGKAETHSETFHAAENPAAAELKKLNNCLLHRDKASKFICEICVNYFCEECPKTFEEQENCCPFCKVACKSADANINEAAAALIQPPAEAGELKKKAGLTDSKEIKNFVFHEIPDDRMRKIGVVPAFVIALLFSAAISIFWVYKIAPYLENRGKDISQNISANAGQSSEKNDKAKIPAQPSSSANTNTKAVSGLTDAENGTDKEPCIDPVTKQPFECDQETRRALYDHTRKVQSVENAQKETEEKTTLILSLVSSEAREKVEKAKPKNPELEAQQAERREKDKQLLIKIFAGSFLIIFGLLMSTRFLGAKHDPHPLQS